MYSVSDFARMAADPARMDAYARAIAWAVRPGSVVLDLGAGTGIMSIMAVRAGAARVHAVDPNPAIWLLPALAKENGCEDRIVVHQASSLDLDVPEPVDVVLSDLRGPMPLVEDHVAALRDVRRRWLAPGGVIVPARDRLQVAVVEAEALSARMSDWQGGYGKQGVAASAALACMQNEVHAEGYERVGAQDVLSTTATWVTLDYGHTDARTVEGTVELSFLRGGMARGLSLFFETELAPGIGFTTAPGHSLVYGRLFLPLASPTKVAPAERATVTVRAEVRGERWAWDVVLFDAAGRVRQSTRQSTFLGTPSSLETLRRGSDTFAPKLSRRGARLRQILEAMDGERSVRDIAAAVAGRYPELDRGADITDEIRAVAMRYGL